MYRLRRIGHFPIQTFNLGIGDQRLAVYDTVNISLRGTDFSKPLRKSDIAKNHTCCEHGAQNLFCNSFLHYYLLF